MFLAFNITPKKLIEFIEELPEFHYYIFFCDGKWEITNEWLCGSFAGRSFAGATEEEAAQKLITYLNQHIGHNSIVGMCVADSGWPDLSKVKEYISSRETKDKD